MDQNGPRVALVTGGNRGLGFEICRKLAEQGMRVILTSRQVYLGEKRAEDLKAEGYDIEFYPLDVNDPDSITSIYEFVLSNYGRLDVLINNAGILIDREERPRDNLPLLMRTEQKILEQTFSTNVEGPYLLCEAFGPIMRKQRYGRIVNVSSNMGQLHDMQSGFPAYRISKTALNAVTRIFADELKPFVIVNSVCPGWVKTDMGGSNAPRSIEEGVDSIIWAATLPQGSPSGKFYRDREVIPW